MEFATRMNTHPYFVDFCMAWLNIHRIWQYKWAL